MIRIQSKSRGSLSRQATRRLRLERLCSRELLAGDWAVVPLDLTGDNATTPQDVLVVINAAEREESAAVMPAADLNADQLIDGSDVELATSALVASLEATTTLTTRSTTAETGISDSISPDWQASYPTLTASLPPASATMPPTTSVTSPGMKGQNQQVTGNISVDTRYGDYVPLVYNDQNLVNDPNSDGYFLYEGLIPFEVEITYPQYSFAVDMSVAIYVSYDGVEHPYRTEGVHSFGGHQIIFFHVPTRDAEVVKVRAELINNSPGLVGNGNALIATAEKVERTVWNAVDEHVMPRIDSAISQYLYVKGAEKQASQLLEAMAPRELSIAQMMENENITEFEAKLLYQERFDAAKAVLQAPIQSYLDEVGDRFLGLPKPPLYFLTGASDPKQSDILEINDLIRTSVRMSEEPGEPSLFSHFDVSFADADSIFKDVTGERLNSFILNGAPSDLSFDFLKENWREVRLLDRMGFNLPLIDENRVKFGELNLHITNPSLFDIKGSTIGADVHIKKQVGDRIIGVDAEIRKSFNADGSDDSNGRVFLQIQY